jgi:small subunit ribosomal protein S4
MHGLRRSKLSEYGVRLREKQKLKFFYGVLERQFRRFFALAAKAPENTGEELLTLLERRLDNVVHRLGFAPSRPAARQLIGHGHILLNGKRCDIPSLLIRPGDEIAVRGTAVSNAVVRLNMIEKGNQVPDFLEFTGTQEAPAGKMTRRPTRGDVDPRIKDIREQLIIELVTR